MKHMLCLALLAGTVLLSGCDLEEMLPAEMVSLQRSQPLAGETALDATVRFDIGSLEVAAERGAGVYSLDLDYDRSGYEPQIEYDSSPGGRGELSVRLESTGRKILRGEAKGNKLRLNLADSLPLNLKITSGVGDSRLLLSDLRLRQLELEAGVGATKLSTYEPNPITCDRVRLRSGVGSLDAAGLGNLNFRELDFEGGVGGAALEFSGEWKQDASIRIEVGVGGVTVRMPREVGVRVEAQKHFLSGLHLEGFEKRDDDYYSKSYDGAKVRVSIRVTTGVGGFKVIWL